MTSPSIWSASSLTVTSRHRMCPEDPPAPLRHAIFKERSQIYVECRLQALAKIDKILRMHAEVSIQIAVQQVRRLRARKLADFLNNIVADVRKRRHYLHISLKRPLSIQIRHPSVL